jgi:hypothetical protein
MNRKIYEKIIYTKINVLLKALVHALSIKVKKIKSRKKNKKNEIKTEKDDKTNNPNKNRIYNIETKNRYDPLKEENLNNTHINKKNRNEMNEQNNAENQQDTQKKRPRSVSNSPNTISEIQEILDTTFETDSDQNQEEKTEIKSKKKRNIKQSKQKKKRENDLEKQKEIQEKIKTRSEKALDKKAKKAIEATEVAEVSITKNTNKVKKDKPKNQNPNTNRKKTEEDTKNTDETQLNSSSISTETRKNMDISGDTAQSNRPQRQAIQNNETNYTRVPRKRCKYPVCIYIKTNEGKTLLQTENFKENVIDKFFIKNKIDGHTIDKVGNLWIYPETREGMVDVLNNKNFFGDEHKKNITEESNPLLIINISLDDINTDIELKRKLENLGVSGFAKVGKNAKTSSNIIKVFCHKPEGRLNLLNNKNMTLETRKSPYQIITKCLTKPVTQCNKCHCIGHEEKDCLKSEYYCGYCNKKHRTSECQIIEDVSQHYCANCLINATHDSYNRKKCTSLKEAEEKLQQKELARLKLINSSKNSFSQNSLNSNFSEMSYSEASQLGSSKNHAERSANSETISTSSSKNYIEEQFQNQMSQLANLLTYQTNEIKSVFTKSIVIAKAEIAQEFDLKIVEAEVRITNNIIETLKTTPLESVQKMDAASFKHRDLSHYINKYTSIEEDKAVK